MNEFQDKIKNFEKMSKEDQDKFLTSFAQKLKDAIQLFDPEKGVSHILQTYNREKLRQYLKNPSTPANNKNLRKLSEYLYTVSYIYRRMVNLKANQTDCKVWNAYPAVSMSEDNDAESILQEYDKTVNIVRNMAFDTQINKMAKQVWKNGVSYGFIYGDPEKDGSFYIHLLDPDYCKVSCVSYYSGVLGFLFDFSYFKGNEEKLEYYDKIFTKLYNEYKRDNIQWKQLPLERTICLKADLDIIDYSIPPMSGLLESIISITDLQAAQDEIDSLQNYKLIWGKLDTIGGTNIPDNFEVDLDLAVAFMEKVNAILPDNVAYALSPLELNTIEFKDNDASDSNVLSKAYKNLVETNGSIVLNSSKITNSTAFKMAVMVEAIDAMSIMPQINAWIKFYLKFNYKIEHTVVEFSDVSPYFRDEEIEKYTKLAGLGIPVKTDLAALLKSNPQKSYGMDYLERELLKLGTERWTNPLVSSNTQSADPDSEGGAPKKNDGDLSDEGVETRDKNKNDK